MTTAGRILALCSALLLLPAAEWSDDADAPGWASSQSYRAARGPVAIRPLDNSDQNLELVPLIANVLSRRGIAVADDAPLLLEFETQTDSNAPRGKPGAIERRREVDIGRERDLGRRDSIDAHIDVLSTTRNSVLTGVHRPNNAVNYSLRATLSERNGPRLWEGSIEYGDIVRDEKPLFASMASRLAELVGMSAERRFRFD